MLFALNRVFRPRQNLAPDEEPLHGERDDVADPRRPGMRCESRGFKSIDRGFERDFLSPEVLDGFFFVDRYQTGLRF